MIDVKNDFKWVSAHVDSELKDDELYSRVLAYMRKYRIDLDRMKDLYHDGLINGIQGGKYLAFSEWFNRFTEWEEF